MIGFIFGYMIGSSDQDNCKCGPVPMHILTSQINENTKRINDLVNESKELTIKE